MSFWGLCPWNRFCVVGKVRDELLDESRGDDEVVLVVAFVAGWECGLVRAGDVSPSGPVSEGEPFAAAGEDSLAGNGGDHVDRVGDELRKLDGVHGLGFRGVHSLNAESLQVGADVSLVLVLVCSQNIEGGELVHQVDGVYGVHFGKSVWGCHVVLQIVMVYQRRSAF